MVTDPIADMLARIKNHQAAGRGAFNIAYSKTKHAIANVLAKQEYIKSVKVVDAKPHKELQIDTGGAKIISLNRVSRPGRRSYAQRRNIPRPMGGAGMVVLSTNKGVMSGQEARRKGLGGEVICEVY